MSIRSLSLIYSLYFIYKFIFDLSLSRELVLSVKILDVGQGDSILITSPERKTILIDGGPNYSADAALFYELPFFKSCYIDVIVLTHPHEDHVAGLNRVMERCAVGVVFENELLHRSQSYKAFLDKKRQSVNENLYIGDTFVLGDLNFEALWPPKSFNSSNLNLHSLVLFLTYKDFEGLFLGDAEVEALRDVNLAHENIDFYKVSHHGSENGIYVPLLERLNPRVSVVSSGVGNRYRHPHNEALSALQAIYSEIFRTDIHGSIEIIYK